MGYLTANMRALLTTLLSAGEYGMPTGSLRVKEQDCLDTAVECGWAENTDTGRVALTDAGEHVLVESGRRERGGPLRRDTPERELPELNETVWLQGVEVELPTSLMASPALAARGKICDQRDGNGFLCTTRGTHQVHMATGGGAICSIWWKPRES